VAPGGPEQIVGNPEAIHLDGRPAYHAGGRDLYCGTGKTNLVKNDETTDGARNEERGRL
jgi:hypothetical protein